MAATTTLLHAVNVTGMGSGVARPSNTLAVTVRVTPTGSSRWLKLTTSAAGVLSRPDNGSLLQPPTPSVRAVMAPKAPKRRRFMRTSLDDACGLEALDVLHPFRAQQRLPVRPAGLAAVIRPYQRIVPKLRQVHEHVLPQSALRVLPDFIRQRVPRLRPLHHFLRRPVLDKNPSPVRPPSRDLGGPTLAVAAVRVADPPVERGQPLVGRRSRRWVPLRPEAPQERALPFDGQ